MSNDKKQFKKLFDMISEYYNARKLNKDELRMYYNGLEGFGFDQIKKAASEHMTNSTETDGRFFPKITDFKKNLEGQKPSEKKLISMARSKETPLGLLAAIMIGGDLNSSDSFYLNQRASDVLEFFDKWKNNFNQNDFLAIEKDFNCYRSGWLGKRFEEKNMLESHFQKLGESKNAEVVRLESAKPNLRLASSINDLVSDKRAN